MSLEALTAFSKHTWEAPEDAPMTLPQHGGATACSVALDWLT